MQNYYELYINGVEDLQEDFVSSFLFDLGAGGVSQKLCFIQTAENFDPKILTIDFVDLVAYFEKPISIESLVPLKNYCKGYDLKTETQKDWIAEWKKHYKPFEIVPDHWVVPDWIDFDAPKDRQILISPGLAFGTGTHATTQIMAQMINEELEVSRHTSFLDVGAGTGILSILMYLKGIKDGVATEIDEMARVKCSENFELNKISEFAVEDENFILNNQRKFSLVVANIIDGVLVQISKELVSAFSETLIVSGILEERNDLFKKNFIEKNNLKVSKSYQLENWWGYVLKRNS